MTVTALTLNNDPRAEIAQALNQAVAETVVTTMMAQNFHWNVTGMSFGSLHALFQEVYEDHFAAQDDLAERIRALDARAQGSLAGALERSTIAEPGDVTKDTDMIATLCKAQETLAATLADAAELAGNHGDNLTEDLCIARGQEHEKFAWMLRSHLA